MKNEVLDNNSIVEQPTLEDKPPIFKTWQQMYAFVLIMHVIVISLFYWLTKAFS